MQMYAKTFNLNKSSPLKIMQTSIDTCLELMFLCTF